MCIKMIVVTLIYLIAIGAWIYSTYNWKNENAIKIFGCKIVLFIVNAVCLALTLGAFGDNFVEYADIVPLAITVASTVCVLIDLFVTFDRKRKNK